MTQKNELPGGSISIYPTMRTIKLSKNNEGGISMDERINPKIDYRIGSVVKYFKRETELTEEEKLRNIYLYKILAFATTIKEGRERGERLVIYQALYNEFETFAKPLDEFRSTVNKEKYPNIQQEFTYELVDFSTEFEGDI